ncbi:unnamed protein product [Orchesella dallaii]
MCPTDSKGLVGNYCGPTHDSYNDPVVAQHFTTTGESCVSPCSNVGYTNSWCYKAGGGWGNCSITSGYDINGAECKNSCDYRKYPYSWCYLKKGGWNYCGQSTVSSLTQYTYLGSKCLTPCVIDGISSTNKCYNATKRKRECSRVPGLSTDNMKCYTKCDTNQVASMKSWYSCRTASDVWSRCSKFETDPNFYHVHRRVPGSRAYFPVNRIDMALLHTANRENVYEIIDEQGPRSVTFYEAVPRTGLNALYESREYHVDATECLRNWRNRSFQVPPGRNTMRLALGGTETAGVRLDLQSRYMSQTGVPYLNLQLQINGISRRQNRGRSTSIAEAQVPEELVGRFPGRVVDALYRSMNERYCVHIGCFNYTEKNQPGPSRRRGTGELLMVAVKENNSENEVSDTHPDFEGNERNFLEYDIDGLLRDAQNQPDLDGQQNILNENEGNPRNSEENEGINHNYDENEGINRNYGENEGINRNYGENESNGVKGTQENHGEEFSFNHMEMGSSTWENELASGINTNFETPDESTFQEWNSYSGDLLVEKGNAYDDQWVNEIDEQAGNTNNIMQNEKGTEDRDMFYGESKNENSLNNIFVENSNDDSESHLNFNYDNLNDDSFGKRPSTKKEGNEFNDNFGGNTFSTSEGTWGNENDHLEDDTFSNEGLEVSMNNIGFEEGAW